MAATVGMGTRSVSSAVIIDAMPLPDQVNDHHGDLFGRPTLNVGGIEGLGDAALTRVEIRLRRKVLIDRPDDFGRHPLGRGALDARALEGVGQG